MDTCCTPTVTAVIIILLICIYIWIKNRGMMPGPRGVPYLGLYPYLTDENIHLKLEEYKKEYGDVFSFTYTGRLYINLGSIKAIREVIVNKSDCFMERFKDTSIFTVMLGNGVVLLNGEPWKVLRKFFIRKFKEYGLSAVRDNMAGPLYDSLNSTIEDLKKSDGKPVTVVEFLLKGPAVAVRRILFGDKGITGEKLARILTASGESFEGSSGVNSLLMGPFARLLFAIKPSFRKNLHSYKTLTRLLIECTQSMERSMNEDHPTCIIEEFYSERNKRRRENDPTWKYFTDAALRESLMQFIGDGIQTVAAFVSGFLAALVQYPDEQEKLFAEITEVVGPNRQPSLEDKPNLPYTNAFINEYIRTSNIFPFFPTVGCTKETTIRGHRIPVGSIALYNFTSANIDPDVFEDPETFNPSRYIPSPGKPKAELPIIFGIGKRSCIGESFVMLQTFLFLTTVVKNFKITAANTREFTQELILSGKLQLTFVPRANN